MARDVTMQMVQLEEIPDLEWPTDPALVTSFCKTLQQGGHCSPIRLNRFWQPDATWKLDVADFERAIALATQAEQQADGAEHQNNNFNPA